MARPRSTNVDWELIEKHYRAGVMTLRKIADEYGVAESVIRHRAKTDHWSRDLTAKINQRSNELLRNELLRKVAAQDAPYPKEKEVVEANAAAITKIVLDQRSDVIGLRQMANGYKLELEQSPEDFVKRVGILKMLTDTQKTLITLEREIFNIDAKTSESPIDAALKKIAELKKLNGN